jgi:hypothetical protein
MKTQSLARAFCVALAAASAIETTACASAYNFTLIADTAGPLSTLANPAIGPTGDVVFRANLDVGGQVIYRGNGGALISVADNSAPSAYLGFGDPVINASGTTAFLAGRKAGGQGIFTVNGATTGTVALTTGAGGLFSSLGSSSLAINSSGLVSFQGDKSGATGIHASVSGGSSFPIAESTGPYSSFAGFTNINDAGTVAFQANLDAGGAGVFSGSGGAVTTLADSSGIINTTMNGPAINSLGLSAFMAGLDAGGTGLFTSDGISLSTIATTAGPFNSFNTTVGNGPSINSAGKIIFRAIPDSGSDGFYDGPNPATNKVIALGDALSGSTVNFLSALSGRMNDSGQFVFFATLNDGRNAIFRADPIPEPSSFVLAAGTMIFLRRRQRAH